MNFNFGNQPQTTATGSTGFSFGGSGDANKPAGFSFPTTQSGGISFGTATTSASTPAVNFGLGSNLGTTASAPAFGLGQSAAQPSAGVFTGQSGTTTNFAPQSTAGATIGATGPFTLPTATNPSNFSAPANTTAAFSFGTPSSTPSFGSTNLTTTTNTPGATAFTAFDAPTSEKNTTGFATPAKTAATGGFSFGTTAPVGATTSATTSTPSTTSSGFSFGKTSTTTSVTTGFSLGTAPSTVTTTTATPTAASLSFGTTTTASNSATTTPSTGFSFGAGTVTTSTTVANTTANPVSTSALQSTVTNVPTFGELEELINKWNLELEEQEKVFMNQALQLNAWDRLLITNGDKVIELSSEVERVKQDQQQLDHELDFVVAQQRELEDLIVPLEKELENIPNRDPDRQHIYQMVEDMDSQLKQMSENLREIIEHINESSKTEDPNDPIVQIGRILNAHMNSLEWIDRNTALIGSQLDQVTKLYETHRREHERSFHLTYE